ATGVVTYALDNAKAATEALTQGQQVSDSFTVQVTDGAATAQASCTFPIVGTNDAPTILAAAASNNVVEAGYNVAGTAVATVQVTKADVDGTASYDAAFLAGAGWVTADAGATYSKATTYGNVVLTTATGVLRYTLDNTLAATQALTTGQQVSEQVTLQVTDGVATASASATITVVGTNDAPQLTGTLGVVYDSNPDTDLIISKNDLIQGYTDPEGDAISIQNVTCVSPGIVHTVTLLPSGDYMITPRPAYVGDATLGYDLVDAKSAVTPVSKTFAFNGTNTPPSVSFGAQTPSSVKEAGGINNGVAGVATATILVTKSDAETTASYAADRLLSNGWVVGSGSTYTHAGTYGTATLNTATDTLTYTLDDTRALTNALKEGESVSETFPIFVTDGRKLTQASASFTIVGSNDAVSLTGTPAVFSAGVEDTTYIVTAAQLTQGFSDPDGTVVNVRDVQCSTGTVVDRGNGTWAITPGANFNGTATIFYNLADDLGFATPVRASLSFTGTLDAPVVKDFVITTYDQAFLRDQVNVPIVRVVRYGTDGTAFYGYTDPNTKAAVELGKLGTFDLLQTSWASFLPEVVNWPSIGNTAAGPAEPFGLRNVQGLFNNIAAADQAGWGAAFRPFARLSNADYSHYMTGGVDLSAAYANPFTTIHDATPRIISQTISSEAAMARADQISGNTLITDHLVYQITDLNTGLPKVGGYDAEGNPLEGGLYFKEDFVRNLNTLPGDPSVTGIFNLFGQFFDHGLDFIGKGGNLTNGRASKIYIDLAPTDPLYDPANGVTSIAISRATVANPQAAGPDGKFRTADDVASPGADGLYGTSDDIISPTNPEYQQHTSPYIDQSQTYGSDDTTTDLLRQ
ncbi:MAG: tandem-95 repeat protein, partial [Planctomycetia bacterium]|nr:tandem-95 repeat protein [Planctomycetia bacterium]